MSVVDRILWIYVQRSYLGTTDVAIGGDNGLYLPGGKTHPCACDGAAEHRCKSVAEVATLCPCNIYLGRISR